MIYNSQGLSTVTKRDFLRLFWPAWSRAFTKDNILSAFRRTGIYPYALEAVLQLFDQAVESRPTSQSSSSSNISASDERRIKRLLRETITDVAKELDQSKVEKLEAIIAKCTAENSILKHKLKNSERALQQEKKKRSHSKALVDTDGVVFTGTAKGLSPLKIQRIIQASEDKKASAEAAKLLRATNIKQKQLQLQAQKVALAQRRLQREEQRQIGVGQVFGKRY